MSQFVQGRYFTEAGHAATVVKLKAVGLEWELRGAVTCPKTRALVLTRWDVTGRSLSPIYNSPDFNLSGAFPHHD